MPDSDSMCRQHALVILVLVMALLHPAGAIAGDHRLSFLSALEVASIRDAAGDNFEIRLFHKEGRDLAAHLAADRSYRVNHNDDYVAVISRPYSFLREAGQEEVAPTFIADYRLEVFARIREEIIARYGESPDQASLAEYVHGYIGRKSYTRGFDIAARVAETREGDCTEHAVLLLALLRMFRVPARMVMGIKMMELEKRYLAFGHAWVEYYQQGEWKAADPTLAVEVDWTYVPVGVLENESLDFRMALLSLMQRMPYRIEVSGMTP